jgi:hypothetical protein
VKVEIRGEGTTFQREEIAPLLRVLREAYERCR